MTVNLVQWRAVIGIFNFRISGIFKNKRCNIIINLISMFETLLLFFHYVKGVYITIITLLFIFALLLCHGDIEINPGPKKLKKNSLSVCHWNLNSLSAHNFSKLTQLKLIFQYINMISYAYQKHTSIPQFLIVSLN